MGYEIRADFGGGRVYADMEQWSGIRRRVLVEGASKRSVLRETGIHHETLEKMLTHSQPPGYRREVPYPKPKIGPYEARIRQILEEDKGAPKKQRHTAKRIFERIQAEGYTGGYTQVKEVVRELRKRQKEVFLPLVHRPGEAQADFGYALVKENGRLRKVAFFVMTLPYSDAIFLQVFDRITTEVLWEAHRRAFEFFQGVAWRITYDNEKVSVLKILSAHGRKLTDGFLQLQSHYLFEAHFCRVNRPNEKGAVESDVRYGRQNFLVPVPQVRELEELNAELVERCRADLSRQSRGKVGRRGERLHEDQAAFQPLPAVPFDACRKQSTTASSLSLVRFDRNDYSVPVRCAHQPVVVKGYVGRVEVWQQTERIAEHRRRWGKDGVSFDPVHYLALLERKPGALDHARPLEGWDLPDCFGVLRRRLTDEEDREGDGTREYIRVLRRLETHALRPVARAVHKGLNVNALTRDAIAQFLLPQEDWRQTPFRLEGREHLRHVRVEQTDVSQYGSLLAVGAGR
jgi:transposase